MKKRYLLNMLVAISFVASLGRSIANNIMKYQPLSFEGVNIQDIKIDNVKMLHTGLHCTILIWSPDSHYLIAKTLPRDKQGDWIVDVDTGEKVRAFDSYGRPVWSPDGNRIAYTDLSDNYMHVVELDKTNHLVIKKNRRIVPIKGSLNDNSDFFWSVKGHKIFVRNQNEKMRNRQVDLPGDMERVPEEKRTISVHVDGRGVYVEKGGGWFNRGQVIYIGPVSKPKLNYGERVSYGIGVKGQGEGLQIECDTEGGDMRLLRSENNGEHSEATCSPDGRILLVPEYPDEETPWADILVEPSDRYEGVSMGLKKYKVGASGLKWSPDGRKVAFIQMGKGEIGILEIKIFK